MPSSTSAACRRTPSSGHAGSLLVTALAIASSFATTDAAARPAGVHGQGGFSVGGTVTGLIGTDMVLALNGGSPVLVTANGNFTFPQRLADGASYAVTVLQQPVEPEQVCSVIGGDGTIEAADVVDVVVDCAVPVPHLTLTVSDDKAYARYGQAITYVVTLTNDGTGDASGLSIAEVDSPQFDPSRANWSCVGAGAGATCTAAGSGALADSGIALPAGRSLAWIVDTVVRDDAEGASLAFEVVASGAGEASASDEDILVLLRTGTDVAYSDGAE